MGNSKQILHTKIRNQDLFCTHCGGSYHINYPIQPKVFVNKVKAFNVLHGDCPNTWTEPVVDQTQSVKEKAMFWFRYGELGASSLTMWRCLIGNEVGEISHPYDPDDFSRCYKLLETVPEWKLELDKLKALSPEWYLLVKNWDTLTEMFEKNQAEKWKNSKEIGMFEFMQKILDDSKKSL